MESFRKNRYMYSRPLSYIRISVSHFHAHASHGLFQPRYSNYFSEWFWERPKPLSGHDWIIIFFSSSLIRNTSIKIYLHYGKQILHSSNNLLTLLIFESHNLNSSMPRKLLRRITFGIIVALSWAFITRCYLNRPVNTPVSVGLQSSILTSY